VGLGVENDLVEREDVVGGEEEVEVLEGFRLERRVSLGVYVLHFRGYGSRESSRLSPIRKKDKKQKRGEENSPARNSPYYP
jgi:hypothetical protein